MSFLQAASKNAIERAGSLTKEALRLLDLLDMAYAELLDRPVTTLSVGQQQRVAAARALMGSPELLIDATHSFGCCSMNAERPGRP